MAEDAAQEIEEEQEECPKCPPVGAPAWMATFADMATLLMAFFVLILSFAEFNVPKFKQISGLCVMRLAYRKLYRSLNNQKAQPFCR